MSRVPKHPAPTKSSPSSRSRPARSRVHGLRRGSAPPDRWRPLFPPATDLDSGLLVCVAWLLLALLWAAAPLGAQAPAVSPQGLATPPAEGAPTAEGPLAPIRAVRLRASSSPFLVVPDDHPEVASALAALPAEGGTVLVRAAEDCYVLSDMLHIDRSNVSLVGEEGACLRLADHVNRPVVLIGSSSGTVAPEERIFDVAVRGLRLDGNRENQDQEGAVGLPNVQNNALGVRGAERVHLERLTLTGARSGGLVISQQASKIFVRSVTFSDNFFDGLAIDGGHEVLVEQFVSEDNDFSGISVDTGSSRIQVRDGLVQRNGDNGVFVRFARESSFSDLTVVDNCNFGVFASHAEAGGAEGLVEVSFSGLRIFRNGNAGFFFGSSPAEGSADNYLVHSQLAGNGAAGEGDEIAGNANAALTRAQNVVTGFRTDGPTNRACPE